MRRVLPLCGVILVAGLAVAAPAQADAGCKLNGTAAIDGEGLKGSAPSSGPPAFTYSLIGTLSDCTGATFETAGVLLPILVPARATVSVSRTLTVGGLTLVEPAATGTGDCTASTMYGVAFIEWPDGKLTILDYRTSAAFDAVEFFGGVLKSVTLPVLDPKPDQPATVTVATTRFTLEHYWAIGALQFAPISPSTCETGVKSATLRGALAFVWELPTN